jgi:hypothetical protein
MVRRHGAVLHQPWVTAEHRQPPGSEHKCNRDSHLAEAIRPCVPFGGAAKQGKLRSSQWLPVIHGWPLQLSGELGYSSKEDYILINATEMTRSLTLSERCRQGRQAVVASRTV